jgi:hypothetical protein
MNKISWEPKQIYRNKSIKKPTNTQMGKSLTHPYGHPGIGPGLSRPNPAVSIPARPIPRSIRLNIQQPQ